MTGTLKGLAVAIGLLVAATPAGANAQRVSKTPPPNGFAPIRTARDSARLMELRAALQRRVAEQVQRELELTADQSAKLQEVTRATAERRRALAEQERSLRRALSDQLKPGIAADQDSVSRLIKALADARVAAAESRRQELQDVSGFLTPVQQARYLMMQERLARRIEMVRDRMSNRMQGRMGRNRMRPRPQARPGTPPPAQSDSSR